MTSAASRNMEIHRLDWQGRTLQIEYEAHWLGVDKIGGLQVAHLQVRSVEPERAELPITETGYRSHFVDRDAVAEAGGPVEYVRQWLDTEARSKIWQARELAQRQLTLFLVSVPRRSRVGVSLAKAAAGIGYNRVSAWVSGPVV